MDEATRYDDAEADTYPEDLDEQYDSLLSELDRLDPESPDYFDQLQQVKRVATEMFDAEPTDAYARTLLGAENDLMRQTYGDDPEMVDLIDYATEHDIGVDVDDGQLVLHPMLGGPQRFSDLQQARDWLARLASIDDESRFEPRREEPPASQAAGPVDAHELASYAHKNNAIVMVDRDGFINVMAPDWGEPLPPRAFRDMAEARAYLERGASRRGLALKESAVDMSYAQYRMQKDEDDYNDPYDDDYATDQPGDVVMIDEFDDDVRMAGLSDIWQWLQDTADERTGGEWRRQREQMPHVIRPYANPHPLTEPFWSPPIPDRPHDPQTLEPWGEPETRRIDQFDDDTMYAAGGHVLSDLARRLSDEAVAEPEAEEEVDEEQAYEDTKEIVGVYPGVKLGSQKGKIAVWKPGLMGPKWVETFDSYAQARQWLEQNTAKLGRR